MSPRVPTANDIQRATKAEDKATALVSSALQRKFISTVDSRQRLQLSNIVINYGLKKIRLALSVRAILYVTLVSATLLWVVTTLISLAFNHSPPALISSVLASLLTAFSFGIIKYLDYHLISSRSDGFPKNLADFALDDDAIKALIRWHRCFLSLRKQVVTSSIVAILGLASTMYVAASRSLDFKVGSYLLVLCCFFAVGHGAYCTLLVPTVVWVLNKQRMRLFWLNPADTRWVKDASVFFTKLSIADALIFAFGMSGLYLLKPWQASGSTWTALTWLLIGVICLSYIFLFPHYYLNKSIKREKESQLQEMQDAILSFRKPFSDLDASEFTELMGLINLYNDLLLAKESAIDLKNSTKALSSLSVLVITYLGPFLLRLIGIKTR